MVFYYTSTGNSLYAAKMLVDDRLISIPQALKQEVLDYKDNTMGIICPDYAGEIPQSVRRFLEKVHLEADYIYMIITYGTNHSIAPRWAKEFAESNGIHVNYSNKLQMVDNWLPGFDMLEEMAVNKHIPEQIEAIKEDIQNRREFIAEDSEDGQAAHDFVQEMGRKDPGLFDGSAIACDAAKCTGCGVCTRICPVGRNILVDGKRHTSRDTCDFCLGCVHACPQNALYLTMPEKNPNARYRNPDINLKEIMIANEQ